MESSGSNGGGGGKTGKAGGGKGTGGEVSPTVLVRPKMIYGLRTDVIGNIHFNLSQEVIYPVEGVLAFHDYVTNKQRFLRLPVDTNPDMIIISPHRKLLVVLETSAKGTSIVLYDMATLKKRRNLELPANSRHLKISQLTFTHDSRSMVVLTQPPDEMLFLLVLDKSSSVFECRATNNTTRGVARQIACNPEDSGQVAVAGENMLMLMSKSDKGFTTGSNLKVNFEVTSLAFMNMDLLLVGNSEDELIVLENGELKLRQKASEADNFDVMWDQEQLDHELEVRTAPPSIKLHDTRVLCMTAFGHGFAFAIWNHVFVFERGSTKYKYERKTVLELPITIYPEKLYQIENMAIDGKHETVIVTAKHSQIYVGILIVPETLKTKYLKFQPLGSFIHIDDIVDVSLCSWKPIIMTASRDQTIRIWNYETELVELVRKFQVDVNIVELNPTGLMAAIGFSDQLRIMQIFLDELNIVKTYNFARCKDVKFSYLGQMMAAAYDNVVAITSVYNLEVLKQLKGHNGTVLSVAWTRNDKFLISGGADGAIYQWDVDTGLRVQEIVHKGTEYLSLCVTGSDPPSVCVATSTGILREFQNSEIVREIPIPSTKAQARLTDVCLARSDLMMYMTNSCGDLFNVQLPFLDTGGGTCTNTRFFVGQVNKLRFSHDSTLLVAIGKSGTLGIWALDNIEGRVAPIDQDLLRSQEVLIPRNLLQEKNEKITNLELRLKQQAEEFQYQLQQNEVFEAQQMAEVHRNYCQALEELRSKNNEIEQRHTEEMNQITFQIDEMKSDHTKQMENMSSQYSERMLIEYQKFSNLRDSLLKLRESYESKLKRSAGILQDTVEGLETDFKRQLDERKELIRELMKEMQDKKIEFYEYCRQVEVENDRNMVEMQLQYENKLTNEKNDMQEWRGKAGVLQKKYDRLNKEVENLLEEVETLKEEHTRSHKTITQLTRNIDDLQKDIADRDYAITAKEKRIHDLLYKNQELDKYKQVLNHKISELKAQIEPKEHQINEKRKHILEMENELAGLNQNNTLLELQLKELKDKYVSSVAELNVEKHRARAGRECIQTICGEIYEMSNLMNSPDLLKAAVKQLFQRHASDDELRRHISLDAQVRDEFQRQRVQIERVLKIYKNRSEDNSAKKKYDKLFKENVILLEEIEKLREENNQIRAHVKKEFSERKAKMEKPK